MQFFALLFFVILDISEVYLGVYIKDRRVIIMKKKLALLLACTMALGYSECSFKLFALKFIMSSDCNTSFPAKISPHLVTTLSIIDCISFVTVFGRYRAYENIL